MEKPLSAQTFNSQPMAFMLLAFAMLPAFGHANICDRTPQVRDAIMEALEVDDCAAVGSQELASVVNLNPIANLNPNVKQFLKAGDFDGLTSLQGLVLWGKLCSLPAGAFVCSLPAGVFDSLTELQTLRLADNQLTELPAGAFDGLTKLQTLYLSGSHLATLPAGVFDGLTGLLELGLSQNQLTELPDGVFDRLTSLRRLYLDNNQLTELPAGVFDRLASLEYLDLAFNDLVGLTAHDPLFARLPSDVELRLGGHDLSQTTFNNQIPLFVSASDPMRQSFVRIINDFYETGRVRIAAYDDAGTAAEPIAIRLGANQAFHFNAGDLENGNAGKGIDEGIGSPAQGDWRLEVSQDWRLGLLYYVRTNDGFLTAMHDVLPRDAQGRLAALTFNPASNTSRISRLRLANTGADAESVSIEGVDDQGEFAGPVRLTLNAGEARTLSAQDLEGGAQGLAGRLGDGAGKWRLFITAGDSVVGMSLLDSASGHISNLSTPGVAKEGQVLVGAAMLTSASAPALGADGLFTPIADHEASLYAPPFARPGGGGNPNFDAQPRMVRHNPQRLLDAVREVAESGEAELLMNFGPAMRLVLSVESAAATLVGHSLSGRLEDDPNSAVTLTQGPQGIMGTVWTPDASYEILPLGDGVHVLLKNDPDAPKPHLSEPVVVPPDLGAAKRAPSTHTATPTDGVGEVDVLVAYTPKAKATLGATVPRKTAAAIMRMAAQHSVDWTNGAYARSGATRVRLRLVGAREVDYVEAAEGDVVDAMTDACRRELEEDYLSSVDLCRLRTKDDGHLDELHELRDNLGADLVSLVTWSDDLRIGGIADLIGAFSVVNGPGLLNYIFAHEIGHNMGLRHDRYDLWGNEEGDGEHHYGYVNKLAFGPDEAKCWRTIMATYDRCLDHGKRYAGRVPYFSNLSATYPPNAEDAAPMGVEASSPERGPDGPADAASSLNAAAPIVAAYRDRQLAAGTFPLLVSASDSMRQGFVRIINESNQSGSVRILAYDDAGNAASPIEIRLGANQAFHFNAGDLENGNANKGINAGVGSPTQGDWRLAFETELAVRVLSFVRTGDGFLTAMHDVLPRDGEERLAAYTFNPGQNRSQVSSLRLVNTGASAESVSIEGVDDQGASAGPVRLTLNAGEARTLSAQDLEGGTQGLTGSLGDGAGKWRLFITAGDSVEGMSLLESPTGHLTNLSTMGFAIEGR